MTGTEAQRILRVFPRRTTATPTDNRAFVGNPPMFWPDADEVHVSVTFTWDRAEGERLAEAWAATGLPVKIGGPAYDEAGGEFVSGRYLKSGYTITSRGCPNHCWFCAVPKREGGLRELPIVDGWNVVDDNLLACSETHINAVFAMLTRQEHAPVFSGGLEAKRLRPWHVELLADRRPQRMYFAYDTPDDLDPLRRAGAMLAEAGFNGSRHNVCAYVLCGYPGDAMDKAEKRMRESWAAGFFPFAMLYRDEAGKTQRDWRAFQRTWTRAPAVSTKLAELTQVADAYSERAELEALKGRRCTNCRSVASVTMTDPPQPTVWACGNWAVPVVSTSDPHFAYSEWQAKEPP